MIFVLASIITIMSARAFISTLRQTQYKDNRAAGQYQQRMLIGLINVVMFALALFEYTNLELIPETTSRYVYLAILLLTCFQQIQLIDKYIQFRRLGRID